MRRNNRKTRRNRRPQKMSASSLRRFVMREAAKLSGELEPTDKVKAEEVDADGYADTLESDIDIYKAMKIKEAKLRRKYRKMIREAKRVRKNKLIAKKRILRNLK
tara:strand:- start:280 stop:594 length:315 start_codon:yes stop_codon:yes gene_type:complete